MNALADGALTAGKPLRLTDKQQQFIEAYRQGSDPTQAALLAGYAPASAAAWGKRLLASARVQAALCAPGPATAPVTQERVINELAAIGFAAISDLCKWDADGVRLVESSQLTREQTAAVAEVIESSSGRASVRIKLHAKLKALEMLGRHLGMFAPDPAKAAPVEEGRVPLSATLLAELNQIFPEQDEEGDPL